MRTFLPHRLDRIHAITLVEEFHKASRFRVGHHVGVLLAVPVVLDQGEKRNQLGLRVKLSADCMQRISLPVVI